MRPHAKRLVIIVLGVALLGGTSAGLAEQRFELHQDDVVVFVGGTNLLHLQQAGYLEAMYVTVTTTYPHVFPGDLPNDKIIVLG